jgi:serine/threonine-protein kinase RsbW
VTPGTTERIEISFPGHLRYLPAVREIVRQALAEEEGYGDVTPILLAVQEACVNAVRHGHGGDVRIPVELSLETFPDHLVLLVADRGPGFRLPGPERLSDPSRENGRGLAIIRAVMDEVEVERQDGRTVLRLVKRRAS